jgi:hypothetical protein
MQSNAKKSGKLVPGDPELLEIIRAEVARCLKPSSRSKQDAIERLQRIGFLTKSGRVSSKYR